MSKKEEANYSYQIELEVIAHETRKKGCLLALREYLNRHTDGKRPASTQGLIDEMSKQG